MKLAAGMPAFNDFDAFGEMVAGRMKKVLGEMKSEGQEGKGGVYGF